MASPRHPPRARVALAALMLLRAAGGSAGAPVSIATVAQLEAFVASGGAAEGVLRAHLLLEGSRIELPSNASLTLRGDAAACGPPPAAWLDAAGLCVLDANAASQHFVVADGASLTLDGLALVNGASLSYGGAVCVGVCDPSGNAVPEDNPQGAALAVYNSLLAYNTAGMPGVASPGGCVNVDVLSTLDIVNSTLRQCVAYGNGGALSVQDSQLSIINSTIEDCGLWRFTLAGALYITQYWYAASATFDAVTFRGNSAKDGGAIYVDWGFPKTVVSCVGCVFDGNLAGYKGGAIYAVGSVLDFVGSVFSDNRVAFSNDLQLTSGGAIRLDPYPILGEEQSGLPVLNSSLTLRSCTLAGNAVDAATGSGGGVYVSDANALYPGDTASSVLIEDCVVSGNSAALGAGLYIGAGGSLRMARTAVSGNAATGSGAGVGAAGAGVAVVAVDCSFTANAAGVAGAALWANGRDGGGAALSLAGCAFADNAAGGHGGALSAENLDAVALDSCSFSNNSVTADAAAETATALGVALRFVQTSPYGAGAGGALFATSAVSAVAPMQLRASNCSFAANAAAYGGGAALLTGVNATLSGCLFSHNAASAAGGALQLDADMAGGSSNTTLAGGTALADNAAPLGAGIALSGAHALLAADVAATGGAAMYGAVIHAAASTVDAAAQLLLPGLSASGNAATAAGGAVFLEAPPAGRAVPACAGCGAGNTAGDYGPGLASAPVRFALRVAAVTRSAAQLPVAAVAYDAYGAVVAEWPQLAATVACFDGAGAPAPGAVSGAAPAGYAAGAATFGALALSGLVGVRFTLAVTLTSPSAAAFAAGATVNASVAVAPCDASEAFDAAVLRCVCRDHSVRLSTADEACVCVPGFFWDDAAAACAACPDGVACEAGLALTAAGFWRAAANDTTAYECAANRCLAVQPPSGSIAGAAGRRRRELLQAAPPALAAANCSEGHTGPLCAVCCAPGVTGCAPGGGLFAFQGDLCMACPADSGWDAWSAAQRGVLLAFVIAGALAALFLLFFLPLLPGASEALLRLYSRALTAHARMAHALCAAPLRDKTTELRLAEHAVRERTKRLVVATDADDAAVEEQLFAAPLDSAMVKHERRKLAFLQLQKQYEQATRPLKILINFWQVCMSFPTTLHVTWPRFFTRLASRLSVVNVHLLALPSLACLHPDPSAFAVFQGYTLGCAAAVALVGAVFAAGAALHVVLQRGSLADKRFMSFTNRCVTAALVVLYLAYPAVSQVVISIFNCQQVGDASYLRADFREQCYTPRHTAHMKAAVFWILVYPVGVPLLFWAALRYYGVPAMARAKVADAWLHACCDHAARHACLQPPPEVDLRALSTANISAEYVAALHALFCGPPGAGDAETPAERGCIRRCRRAGKADPNTAAEPPRPGRDAQLEELLRWARGSEVLTLPLLQWRLEGRLMEEAETPLAATAPPLPPSPQEKLAEDRIGFLFEAYHVQCWYWEIVELLRKFLLTGVMSLVSPGSAAQVVMGLLVSFAAVVLYARRRPYSELSVNRLGLYAQVNMTLFLLVALLLKVKADEANSDSRAYNGIVGTLSLSLLVVPPINKLIAAFSDDIDASIEYH